MGTILPYPPTNATPNDDARQLVVVRRYLYRLVDELNRSINSLEETVSGSPYAVSSGSNTGGRAGGGGTGGLTPAVKEAIMQTAGELKSLIIKNAKEVASEIEEITQNLENNYLAVSDFGIFQENINTTITASANQLSQEIEDTSIVLASSITDTKNDLAAQIKDTTESLESSLNEKIDSTAADLSDEIGEFSNAFSGYVAKTNGYIRQGIIGYDGLVPIIGIAIGQDITVTGRKETVDGVEYEEIDTSHNMSIWTTKKLSFYVNGTEVAYFANNALIVNKVDATEITVGGNWLISEANGFSIKWIGGNT